MIGYVTLGAQDMDRACAFYDALLGELGAKRAFGFGRIQFWAVAPNRPMLAVCTPFDGEAAAPGNGTMTALTAKSRGQVDAIHAKALELGGTDEGAAGERNGVYIAYFRDLDGNKLGVFTAVKERAHN